MAEDYPFPIPEAIQNKADDVIANLGRHVGAYFGRPPNSNPQCLNALNSCHLELSIILDAIVLAGDDLSGRVGPEREKETSLLLIVTRALETELDRMGELLKWGFLTWRYDPAIQRALSKEPEETPRREDIDPEQAAVADTQADNTPEETDDQDRLPYSLPPEVWEQVKPVVDRLQRINRQWLPLGLGGSRRPNFLHLMENLDLELEETVLALEAGIDEVRDTVPIHHREEMASGMATLRIIRTALEHLSKTCSDYLEWGCLTWKHDPAIQGAFKNPVEAGPAHDPSAATDTQVIQ